MRLPDTNFDRVRTALLCGTPDRVPIFELKVDEEVKAAFLGHSAEGVAGEIEFQLRAGYDYVRIRPEYDFIYESRLLHKDEYSLYGNHQKTIPWVDEKEGPIASRADFENFPWPKGTDIRYARLEEASRLVPEGMKIISGTTGIWESAWMLMGFERFSFALVDEPDLVRDLFQKVGEVHLEMWRTALDFPNVAAMWYTDDWAYYSGPMISPEVFRRHVFPWVRKMGECCRQKGVPFILHSDGNLWLLMDDILALGFNCIHPVEPKAMEAVELKRKFHGGSPSLAMSASIGHFAAERPKTFAASRANGLNSWAPMVTLSVPLIRSPLTSPSKTSRP